MLRLKYPVVCTHGGEIIPSASISSAAPLAVVSGELASMRKDLNKVRVERSKERRDFEASVRRYKAAVKTNHREIEKRLSGAQAAATWMEKLHNDSKKHAAWWRKQAHAQAKEMKLLRAELAESRVSGSQQAAAANQAESDLSRQAWVVGKLTARLESEKSAYRQRAAKERQQKQMAKKIGTLQEAAAAAKAEAEAMRSAAAAAQAELSEMGLELVQAKELQQALQQSLEAEAHKAHEAQQLAQQAEVEKEAEQERAASVVAARDALAGELAHVREQADLLAQCASALTAPKYRDGDMSYRTECRAHQEDKEYLTRVFNERPWRGDDVATVLHEAGLLRQIFDSSEVRGMARTDSPP